MQMVLPEQSLPSKLIWDPEALLSDDQYFELCAANPSIRFERTAQGEIVIVPPAGFESDYRCARVVSQLTDWAERHGRGKVSGPTVEFFLPTGAALSPDAAWTSNERIRSVSKEQLKRFPHLCPEFVVEVLSPSDRLNAAKNKMAEWMRGGAELAWLIDGDHRTVYIYSSGSTQPEIKRGLKTLAGEGPVAGFVLDLKPIWAGI
jgi:Uma2 family endonuclease